MKLLKVEGMNFMAFRKFRLDLQHQGLTLIEGQNFDKKPVDSNGSSKSSLIDSIPWTFWGRTPRGLSGDEIITRGSTNICRVRVSFTIRKEAFQIERSRGTKISENSLTLLKGSRNLSKATSSQTQELIDNLIDFKYDTFMSTAYFCQGLTARFFSLSSTKRYQLIESLANLQIFEKCEQVAGKRLDSEVVSLGKILNAQQKVVAQRSQCESYSEELKKEAQRIMKGSSVKFDERLYSTSEDEDKDIAKVAKNLLSLRRLEGLEKQELERQEKESQRLSLLYTRMGIRQDGLQEDIKELRVKTQKCQAKVNSLCPFCGQKITRTSVKKFSESLKKKEKSLAKKKEKLQKASEEAHKALTWEEHPDDLNVSKQIRVFVREAVVKEEEVARKEQEIQTLLERQKSFDSLNKLLKKKKLETEKLVVELKKLGEKANTLERNKEVYTFWATGFGKKGIRTTALSSTLQEINRKIAFFGSSLLEKDIRVQLTTKKEMKTKEEVGLDIKIKKKEESLSYKSLSGGEKRRVDLCLLFGLQNYLSSRVKTDLNVVFFDEVFDALDRSGSEKTINLLKSMLSRYETIFVITQDSNLKVFFDNVITVVKERGEARVEKR